MTICPCCKSEVSKPFLVSLDTNKISAGPISAQVSPKVAELLHILVEMYPATVDYAKLRYQMYGAQEEPESKTEHVYAFKARVALEDIGWTIKSVWGRGYRLEQIQS